MKPKQLRIRPYARLLTMLGEQLIKNERIALIELIKNSYDADADWVKVSFINFTEDFKFTPESKIIIEDNGCGMNEGIIQDHWLNPATPEKKRRKAIRETTLKGRFIQGEKGIGRFAVLKLGRKIKIFTRVAGESVERVLTYDFSQYDDEFLSELGVERDLFLDDLTVLLETRKPEVICEKKIALGNKMVIRQPKGTQIEISDLKGIWSGKKLEYVYRDIARLESIFSDKFGEKHNRIDENRNIKIQKENESFHVLIYKDNELQPYQEELIDNLNLLLDDRSVFRIENGIYDEERNQFRFLLNDIPTVLELSDPKVTGLRVFKEHFGDLSNRTFQTECGSFSFGFYVFDFSPQAPAKYQLDGAEKNLIREHRVYLYRDGIRVYPYGDPDDDWLRIDQYRGTISAGQFLSNDQVVGFVNISHKQNPRLKDKTNREGLIEDGNATEDFFALLRVFLAYIRSGPYRRYRLGLEDRTRQDVFRTQQVQQSLNNLKEAVKDNPQMKQLVDQAEKIYQAERKYLVQRAETTEELAGVGLSVETASHDIMAIMGKVLSVLDNTLKDLLHDNKINPEELLKDLQSLRGMLSFIEAQLKDIQLLFKSSKRRRRKIKVKEILEKVERIYRRLLKDEHIELVIEETGSPVIAKTTDAVLLQVFLNLLDNAVYWLKEIDTKNKRILIKLDGNQNQMIFSDNGPGISKVDQPYIFEPFYSGKGVEGRGLGLYIARQLLERNDYSIELADLKADKILSGANFVVSFIGEE